MNWQRILFNLFNLQTKPPMLPLLGDLEEAEESKRLREFIQVYGWYRALHPK